MYFRLEDPAVAASLSWLLSRGHRGRPDWPSDIAGWHRFVDYAEANGVGSVVACQLQELGPPPPDEVQERLDTLDRALAQSAERASEHAASVAGTLSEAGIPHYWLKGAAWGEALYRDIGTRPMRDIDLIVPSGWLEVASRSLHALGYRADPLATEAGQHLPRFSHPSGVKIDLHHRIVPTKIYGFRVNDPVVPWGSSAGLVLEHPTPADGWFHLQHMIIHVFHHSFYNLRLMHLFDIKLALEAWNLSPGRAVRTLAGCIPQAVARDILGLCDALFDIGGAFRHFVSERTFSGFVRDGSMPLLYPLMRTPRLTSLPNIAAAEVVRALFVLRSAPGRFGRRAAELHPPT